MGNKSIFVVSDYGIGDPAFAEVVLRLRLLAPEAYIQTLSTPPFSTINTGFWIYQLALTENVQNTYIYSNTAPRKEDKNAQKNNRGEKLMYARLKNGFEIMAVNAGCVFSFVKPYIEEFFYVNVPNEGSQFRSRDKYPPAVAQMVKGEKKFKGEKASVNIIPAFPTHTIAAIDGYGNIKTTTRQSEVKLRPGKHVTITIDRKKHRATYTDGVFNIKDGELAYSPGSSGHDDPFMEIFVRGGSAFELFNFPEVEEKIHVVKS